jgi:hypothetical protein
VRGWICAFLVALFLVLPRPGAAQSWALVDSQHATEIGVVQEWFHRDLEPPAYDDTRWSSTALSLSYCAADWLKLGFEGGTSEFEADDFPGSTYQRYLVGGFAGVRVWQWNGWDVSANARYLDTFDLDTSENLFHKRVRSVDGSVNVARTFDGLGQAMAVWAGPMVVNDFVQTYPLDSLDAFESSSGTGWGVNAGARVILGGWIAVYGFASYVEEIQGGFGISLYAGKGSL